MAYWGLFLEEEASGAERFALIDGHLADLGSSVVQDSEYLICQSISCCGQRYFYAARRREQKNNDSHSVGLN